MDSQTVKGGRERERVRRDGKSHFHPLLQKNALGGVGSVGGIAALSGKKGDTDGQRRGNRPGMGWE